MARISRGCQSSLASGDPDKPRAHCAPEPRGDVARHGTLTTRSRVEMLSTIRKGVAAAVAFAAVLAGCKDSTGPRAFSGTYVLTEIDGSGAPLVTSDHTFSNGERLVHSIAYDTIQFTSATSARRSESFQSVRYDVSGTPQQALGSSSEYTGTVQRNGDVVTITWRNLGPQGLLQELRLVDGMLEWQTMVGLICSDNCPPPRIAVFTYAKP